MLEVLSAMQCVGLMPPVAIRGAINSLHEYIQQNCENIPEACPVRHFFAPGQYCREITIPAGMVVVGRIHKHAHINIITKGKAYVLTPQRGMELVEAPCTFVSDPITQRLVVPLEDITWSTVHVTDCTDPEAVIEEITVKDFNALEILGEYTEVSE